MSSDHTELIEEVQFEDDIDSKGHLAAGLFVAILALLLVLIYAMANAA